MQVDVGEQAPPVVEEALTGDPGPTGGHSALQAQGPQGTDAIGRQIHAGPGNTPAGFSFDHLRSEPGLAQSSGQGQTGQASPHDQDPVVIHGDMPTAPFRKAVIAAATDFGACIWSRWVAPRMSASWQAGNQA
jgi:hypothetical protein